MNKHQDTKERILEEGGKALLAKSYNGCGLNEILKAAGVPKGSFYHYFKSKEDFGVAIIERFGELHLKHMQTLLNDRAQSPLERLHSYYTWIREYHADKGHFNRECLIAKFALEISQLSEPMRIAIKYAYDSWAMLLAKVIREAQQADEINAGLNPEKLANFLINLWEGATIRMQIDRKIDPLDEVLDLVFKDSFLK